MSEYHKIQTVFKRDPATKHKTLLEGEYSLPEFEYLANNTWVFTEKVDGTNIRVIFDGQGFEFRGKTDRAQVPPMLHARLQEKFCPMRAAFAEQFADGVILYGEGYGAKIQKGGGNYRPDQDFVLFDVNIGGWWLNRADVESIAIQHKIEIVPIVGYGTLGDMVNLTRWGLQSLWGGFTAEGIVARPRTELRTRAGNRIITKIKHRDFPHGD